MDDAALVVADGRSRLRRDVQRLTRFIGSLAMRRPESSQLHPR